MFLLNSDNAEVACFNIEQKIYELLNQSSDTYAHIIMFFDASRIPYCINEATSVDDEEEVASQSTSYTVIYKAQQN